MLICMSTKNVYVSDQDLPLFEEATKYAGSLSTAVAAGLRMFIDAQKQKGLDLEPVELKINDDGRLRTVRFVGRMIYKFDESSGTKRRINEIFITQKNNYVLYQRVMPNWNSLAAKTAKEWEDGQPADVDFTEAVTRTMSVYQTLDELKKHLPAKQAAAVDRTSSNLDAVEELDI